MSPDWLINIFPSTLTGTGYGSVAICSQISNVGWVFGCPIEQALGGTPYHHHYLIISSMT